MSDFDNLFREKLDEEQSFPRRNKNWNMVSKRLDAFDAGGVSHHSYLTYWKIATLAAAIIIGVLAWKLVAVQQENARLKELSAKSEVDSAKSETSAKSEAAGKNAVKEILATESTKRGNAVIPVEKARTEGRGQPEKQRSDAKEYRKSAADVPREKRAPKTEKQNSTAEKAVADHLKQPAPAVSANNPADRETQHTATESGAEKVAQSQQPAATNPEPSSNFQKDSTTDITEATATAAQAPDKQEFRNEESLASPAITPDSSAIKTPVTAAEKPVAAVVQPDTTAGNSKAPELIKPERTYSHVRAGAQIIGAFAVPAEQGVSMLRGQGITAAWRFWKGFSLTAAADWMRFDLNTTRFIQRFHPHHNGPSPHGGGPGHEDMLVNVESTQRQRQLSLGLQYKLPLRFWVQPTVQVAHTWVRIDPYLISYKFEEEYHGGPGGPMHDPEIRYQVEKTNLQRLDNIWRVGLGLQRETQRWIFSAGADYMKDVAASDAMFNSVVVKAGLQYKIF